MPTWVIIAALATIGITALLMGVLHRINAPKRDDGGGYAPVFVDPGDDANDSAGDGGSDGGGSGDGGS